MGSTSTLALMQSEIFCVVGLAKHTLQRQSVCYKLLIINLMGWSHWRFIAHFITTTMVTTIL